MDTKTLKIGQDVELKSQVYYCEGRVVEVTPDGVIVRATMQSNLTNVGNLLHFDNNGKGSDEEGTYECGPWYIGGPISKEQIALRRETIAKNEQQRLKKNVG